MCLPRTGYHWSGSMIMAGSVIGSPMHRTRKANKKPDASQSAPYLYDTGVSPGPPTHLPLNLWPLTLLSPAHFFPASTTAAQLSLCLMACLFLSLVLWPQTCCLPQDAPLLDIRGPRCFWAGHTPPKTSALQRALQPGQALSSLPGHMHIIKDFLFITIRHLAQRSATGLGLRGKREERFCGK